MCSDCVRLNGAKISEDCRYRYWLRRCVCEVDNSRYLLFIMLNPSTADATKNDRTIRKCIGFAQRWEFGVLEVVNLFALRATDPYELRPEPEPIGPINDAEIEAAARRANKIVCAWGNDGAYLNRSTALRELLSSYRLHYLKFNNIGEPRHPLYIRGTTLPVRW